MLQTHDINFIKKCIKCCYHVLQHLGLGYNQFSYQYFGTDLINNKPFKIRPFRNFEIICEFGFIFKVLLSFIAVQLLRFLYITDFQIIGFDSSRKSSSNVINA